MHAVSEVNCLYFIWIRLVVPLARPALLDSKYIFEDW